MARSVLEIAQDTADVIGLEPVGALVGTNIPATRALLVLLNRSGNTLIRARNAQGASWKVLERTYIFNTAAGQEFYPLPGDFLHEIDGTAWDREQFDAMAGPLSPQEWQQVKSSLVESPYLSAQFRLVNQGGVRGLLLDPVPGGSRELVIEYISSGWLRTGSGVNNRVVEDTDTPLLDDELIAMDLLWRFKHSRGLSFAGELAEFEMERDRRMAQDMGSKTVMLGGNDAARSYPNMPETIPT